MIQVSLLFLQHVLPSVEMLTVLGRQRHRCDFVFMFLFPDVKFEIDLPKKLVWIESDKDVDVLMTALQKSGKEVKYNGTK